MKYPIYLFALFSLLLFSCNRIKTGDSLTASDIQHIESLNLLDKDEKIIKFYSEYKNRVAGNFYTDKRIAAYWIDEHNAEKNRKESAFYNEIAIIDTIYNAGLTYSPYLQVTTVDGRKYKVCAGGEYPEIKSFFEGAISKWKESKEAE